VRGRSTILLVITDSDVRSRAGDICEALPRCSAIPGVGGVTALYRGQDNLQFVAAHGLRGFLGGIFAARRSSPRELEGLKFMMGSTMGHDERASRGNRGFEAMVDLHSGMTTNLAGRIAAPRLPDRVAPEPVLDGVSLADSGRIPPPELRWAIGIRTFVQAVISACCLAHGHVPWAIAAVCVAPSAAVWCG